MKNRFSAWQKFGLSILGGIIYIVIFSIHYSFIDSDLYEFRDDGVITMSVGRHFVDFGFFGVSPSGPIVEASSSPLQTLIYALLYAASKITYQDFSTLQTYACHFLIGCVFIMFFKEKPRFALIATLLSALLLSFLYPYALWHASGMENALTHLLILTAIYGLYRMVDERQVRLYWLPIFFMAAIVRIEIVFHIAILLAFFSIYWFAKERDFRAFRFSVYVGLLWILLQLLRYWYFGDFLPNTAYAQNISVGSRLAGFFGGNPDIIQESLILYLAIFVRQGWWLLFLAIPLVSCGTYERSKNFILIAIGIFFASTALNPLLFGPSRIDIVRTTTQVTLLVVLFLAVAGALAASSRRFPTLAAVSVTIGLVAYNLSNIQSYYLGWSTIGFNQVRTEFAQLSAENEIHRPLVANPDLGVMTWHKTFNVLDLGRIGSPTIAKFADDGARADYILEFAQPDFIESHGYWTRLYCPTLFLLPRFAELYGPISGNVSIPDLCDADQPGQVVWIRRDIAIESQSAERELLNDLQQTLDIRRIESELAICEGRPAGCAYVVRTAYRFIPEFRRRGLMADVLDLFGSEVARAYLSGSASPQAHMTAIGHFERSAR